MRLFGWFRLKGESHEPYDATAAQCRELLRALDAVRPQSVRWDDDYLGRMFRLKTAIGDLGMECLDTLLAQLAVQNWGHVSERDMARRHMVYEARQIVISLIAEFEDPRVIGRLKAELQLGNHRDRKQAIVALGRFGDPSVVEDVAPMLKDPNVELRMVAAIALGSLRSAAALTPLCDALTDTDAAVRGNAAWALGEIGEKRAVECLWQFLLNATDRPKDKALHALGRLGDVRVTEELIKASKGRLIGRSDAPLVGSLRGVGQPEAAWQCAARVLGHSVSVAAQIPKKYFAKATDVTRKAIIAMWWENFLQTQRTAIEILSSGPTEEQALAVKAGLLRMVSEYGRRDVLIRLQTVHSFEARAEVEGMLNEVKGIAREI